MDQDKKNRVHRDHVYGGLFSHGDIVSEDMGMLMLPNTYAESDFKYTSRKVTQKTGKVIEVTSFTPNSVKISDTCLALLQNNFKKKTNINYWDVREEVENSLSHYFEEWGLDEETLSSMDFEKGLKGEKAKRIRLRSIKIESEVKKLIAQRVADSCSIEVDFREFVNMLKISTLFRGDNIRLAEVLKVITTAQDNSFSQHKVYVVEEDKDGIHESFRIARDALIPKIAIQVRADIEDGGEEINTFDDLVSSKKRNKEKYIEKVVLTFDPETIASKAFPRRFSLATLNKRHRLNNSHASRLDSLIRSIEKIQHYTTSVNRFTFSELLDKFGVSYEKYASFKLKVLLPAIKSVNLCGDYIVELVEHRKNNSPKGKLLYLSFKISHVVSSMDKYDFTLPYYICVQHFSNPHYLGEDFTSTISFDEHYEFIEECINNLSRYGNISFGGIESNDYTYYQWDKIYRDEVRAFYELREYLSANLEWMKNKNIALSAEKLTLVNIEDNMPYKPLPVTAPNLILDTPSASLKFYLEDINKGKK